MVGFFSRSSGASSSDSQRQSLGSIFANLVSGNFGNSGYTSNSRSNNTPNSRSTGRASSSPSSSSRYSFRSSRRRQSGDTQQEPSTGFRRPRESGQQSQSTTSSQSQSSQGDSNFNFRFGPNSNFFDWVEFAADSIFNNNNQPRASSSTTSRPESGSRARTSVNSSKISSKDTIRNKFAGANFEEWSIKDLKQFLAQCSVDTSTCIEKKDLVEKCRAATWPLPNSTDDEAHQCKICFDRMIDAVLIPCGHQWCSVCSYNLKTCPACQTPVESRVRTYR